MNNTKNTKQIKYHPCKKGGKLAIEACPEVRDWWDYEKNIDVDLTKIAAGSSKEKYHFRCPVCFHPFYRAMATFLTKQSDGTYHVPVCQKCHPSHSSLRVLLSDAVVDIDHYWDHEKNNGKLPSDFSASNQTEEIWTFCPICGKSTTRRPRNTWKKDENGVGHVLACKACGKLNNNNSLISLCRQIKDYWIYEENEFGPECFTISSGKPQHIRCPECGNNRFITINDAVARDENGNYYVTSCRECGTKKGHATRRQKDFNILKCCPDIDKYWADSNFKPGDLTVFAHDYIQTLCPSCGKTLYRRALNTFKKEGDFFRVISCHDCATTDSGLQRGLSQNGPLIDECSEFAEWWDDEKNTRSLNHVTRGSHYEAWVKCPACHHEMHRDVHSFVLFHKDGRLLPIACPECGYSYKGDPEDNLLKLCPKIADWWNYELNYPFRPEQFSKGSQYPAHLTCPDCGLDLFSGIHSLVHTTEDGRVVISHEGRCRKYRAMESDNNLVKLFPQVKDWWDYELNYPKLPEEYTIYSGERVHFRCLVCNIPTYRRIADAFVPGKNGEPILFTCPYCQNKKVYPGFNSFKTRHEDLMKQWATTENLLIGLDPDRILDTSSEIAWWNCEFCSKKYPLKVYERVMKKKRGRNPCPFCNGRRWKKIFIL